jgi:hypothetical protein
MQVSGVLVFETVRDNAQYVERVAGAKASLGREHERWHQHHLRKDFVSSWGAGQVQSLL